MTRPRSTLASAALIFACFAGGASAQVNNSLILKPWGHEEDLAETLDDVMIQDKGHTRDSEDDSIRLWMWDSTGRVRLNKSDPEAPRIGYRALFVDIDNNHSELPVRLTDTALAAGFHAGQVRDWTISFVLGAGYAGTNPFADSDAIYGVGSVMLTRPIGERDHLTLSLNYYGMRTIWPEAPLPGIAYSHVVSDELSLVLGFPTAVTWKPIDRLTLEAGYVFPADLNATATYELAQGWSVYGSYGSIFEAFEDSERREGDRIFMSQERAELGVRWVFGKWVDLTLAGGYAFGQEFSHGWDARDLHDTVELSDEPYVRFMLRGRF